MRSLLTKIGIRLALLALVGGVAVGAYMTSGAFGATAATYSVGGIDLKVNSRAFYNGSAYAPSSWYAKDLQPYVDKFFKFYDIKPGDYGRTIISLHVKKASAYVCLAFSNFKDLENDVNEPEDAPDLNNAISGELGEGMEFFSWRDDGDNVFEVGEVPLFGTTSQSAIQTLKNKTYALADYAHGPTWPAGSVRYVGIAWCAGDLMVNLATAVITCDGGTLGNEAQTDSLMLDVSLTAVPYTQDPKFLCVPPPKDDECDDEDDEDDDDEIMGGHRSSNYGGDDDSDDSDDDDEDEDEDENDEDCEDEDEDDDNDDEDDDKEHEYSWYNWGYDSYGHGGSCNLGKRS